ncbi:KGGVGR-motif variant AAA ATPase [Streptomyces sp. NPDC092296]|uniref:KGGVGR-motif variant AAA ATPase n=1 Tax=Streptomyces sp. NPDC092296 TaxID=3366012 RepID=UPI003811D79D
MSLFPDPVRFDKARPLALEVARGVAATGVDVLVVRDLLGQVSLLLDDREQRPDDAALSEWRDSLTTALGRYASSRPVVLGSSLFQPAALFDSPRIVDELDQPAGPGQGCIRWLESTVVGEDWSRVRQIPEESGVRAPRVTLYGFKGGVGRSTATAMLAKHLADLGNRVLVVDLDLESPGSGPLLLSEEATPWYGLIDQLVESAVGNAEGLDLVAQASNYDAKAGEIWVAPARGKGAPGAVYSYVEKLNRIYADLPTKNGAGFADRLEEAIAACEEAVTRASGTPDVILLDSRAGIHDIAAVAISRLCDLALLFGADNAHTWNGYRDLFTAWRDAGQARVVRDRLRMVASMVPDSAERPMDAYLDSFRENAWSCFSVLYDDVPSGGDLHSFPSAYNPSPEEDSAPHSPIPILFTLDLVGIDAISTPGWSDRSFVKAAYDSFLTTATHLIFPGGP